MFLFSTLPMVRLSSCVLSPPPLAWMGRRMGHVMQAPTEVMRVRILRYRRKRKASRVVWCSTWVSLILKKGFTQPNQVLGRASLRSLFS